MILTKPAVLPLEPGDRLTRAEFERRYEVMPHVKKAELIEGVVYMPSPVRLARHSSPHANIVCWLGLYQAATTGVQAGDNPTVRLDTRNEPQPDALLFIRPEYGGQARISDNDYLEGAPELVVEIAASSASYDLHTKLEAYQRNGICEYIVWRTLDGAIDWFVLRNGQYEPLVAGQDNILRSEVYPGLWLDTAALLTGDMAQVVAVAQQGTVSTEHGTFLAKLHTHRGA